MSIFKAGKKDIAALYDKYADMLFRIALLQLKNTEDAEDAVHDVFIKFMHTNLLFSSEDYEKAWFIRVTVNHCHDMFRKNSIRKSDPIEEAQNVFYRQYFDEASAGIMEALQDVPEKNREAMILHYLEGFSVEETAKILGISLSGVKMRLSRGRDVLKALLNKEDNDAR